MSGPAEPDRRRPELSPRPPRAVRPGGEHPVLGPGAAGRTGPERCAGGARRAGVCAQWPGTGQTPAPPGGRGRPARGGERGQPVRPQAGGQRHGGGIPRLRP